MLIGFVNLFEQLMLVCCLAIVAVALADKDKEKQEKKKEDGNCIYVYSFAKFCIKISFLH